MTYTVIDLSRNYCFTHSLMSFFWISSSECLTSAIAKFFRSVEVHQRIFQRRHRHEKIIWFAPIRTGWVIEINGRDDTLKIQNHRYLCRFHEICKLLNDLWLNDEQKIASIVSLKHYSNIYLVILIEMSASEKNRLCIFLTRKIINKHQLVSTWFRRSQGSESSSCNIIY